jgi:hypothetical protein
MAAGMMFEYDMYEGFTDIFFWKLTRGTVFGATGAPKGLDKRLVGFGVKTTHWGGGISCLTCAGNCYEPEDGCQKDRESEKAFVRLGPWKGSGRREVKQVRV